MVDNKVNNNFKFSLYQGDILFCERIFNADKYNPFTRYSIDIREILPLIITKLQKILSKRSYFTIYETSDYDSVSYYELYQYHQKMISLYPRELRSEMRYNPQPMIQKIDDKVIRGVECKLVFYINDKTIVERIFFVDGFNSVARWSIDLIDAINDITYLIEERIKKTDRKNIWDDYYLIKTGKLSFSQIRELPLSAREEMLRKIKSN